MHSRTCLSCGSTDLWRTTTPANGGYGPALLPSLGALFKSAKFDLVLCADCGHVAFYADKDALQRLKEKKPKRWTRVKG
ncbi:MAG: hypothetical protein H6834_04805 [Planctomycetes bacterium]|nr:hypothetical protein [Planctomycetota bacterium]